METLPLDILLYIIVLLSDSARYDYEDVKSLRNLSQTCKFMVPLCRKHLFSYRLLHSKEDSERFSGLLLKNPDIAGYLRNLNYRFYLPISDHELKILEILKKCSSLKMIKLSSPGILEWNDLPESMRSSLVFLTQLPSVTYLDIDDIIGFPATALSGCSNLIDLRLGKLDLVPEVNQVISRSRISTPLSLYMWKICHGLAYLLNSASPHAGGTIINFSRLQKTVFDVEFQGDIGQINELIKVTSRLEHFNLNRERTGVVSYPSKFDRIFLVVQPLGLTGLGASLAVNAYRTIKTLEFGVTVLGEEYGLLCGFNRELRFIAGNNILEVFRLYVDIVDETLFQTESEDWSALDLVLTESGAFPKLHRVLVEISWWSEDMGISEREAFLESLKEDKLSRLMKSKAVKLDFSAHFADNDDISDDVSNDDASSLL